MCYDHDRHRSSRLHPLPRRQLQNHLLGLEHSFSRDHTMKIKEYEIETDQLNMISMNRGSKILCVRADDQRIYLVALVEPTFGSRTRCFRVFQTEEDLLSPFDEDLTIINKYVGTVTFQGEDFHIFEEER